MASNPTKEMRDEFLNTIRLGQETVIEAVRTWVETVQAFTPKVPPLSVPLAGRLPKPEEVVASAYDFAEKLLASQRQFAEEVLSVTAPLAASAQKAGNGQKKAPERQGRVR
jgi:hypothetical protein